MPIPLVSVLMCVRDGEKYLGAALDSVSAQGLEQIEMIVVDDGSTDGSAALAEHHVLAPQVCRQPARGLSHSRNLALGLARGQYLAVLDCDDVWPAGRLRALLAGFTVNPAADFVYGRFINTDAELRPTEAGAPVRSLNSGLVTLAAARHVGDFRTDVEHGSNVDWISRAVSGGMAFAAIDDIVLLRRVHGENMGAREQVPARRDMLKVIRDHHARRRK